MKRILILWMVAATLTLVIGCNSKSDLSKVVAVKPTVLVNGILSHQGFEEFRQVFLTNAVAWKIIEQSGLRPDDKRPYFNILTIEISNYACQGHVGTLHVKFFNNRLMDTWFITKDFKSVVSHLKEQQGITFNIKGEADISVNTRVKIYQSNDLSYIAWYDKSLVDEMNKWIRTNAFNKWIVPYCQTG